MIKWFDVGYSCHEGYLPGFDSMVIGISHQSNYDNRKEYGFVVKLHNLPFKIKAKYHKTISKAKAYAEEVLRDFIVKLNQLMKNEEEN